MTKSFIGFASTSASPLAVVDHGAIETTSSISRRFM
jgi:hypothetical protein